MKDTKIFAAWTEGLIPSEIIILAYLQAFQEENGDKGCAWYGSKEDLHEKIDKTVSYTTMCVALNKGNRLGYLDVVNDKDFVLISVKDLPSKEYYFIPDLILKSKKLSPLQKLYYAFVYSTPFAECKKESMATKLNVTKNKRKYVELDFLVERGFLSKFGDHYKINYVKEEDFKGLKEWHKQYKTRAYKPWYIRVKNFLKKLFAKKNKTKKKGTRKSVKVSSM